MTDVGLTAVARSCPGLRELVVASCTDMTNAGVRFVGFNLRYLRSVSINRCIKVTDPGLAALCSGCTQVGVHLQACRARLLGMRGSSRSAGVLCVSVGARTRALRDAPRLCPCARPRVLLAAHLHQHRGM